MKYLKRILAGLLMAGALILTPPGSKKQQLKDQLKKEWIQIKPELIKPKKI
jgi:hypothetical protein